MEDRDKEEGEATNTRPPPPKAIVSALKQQAMKPKRLTHFLCLVTASDQALTKRLCEIQDHLVLKYKLPQELRVNVVDDLHVTLMTLNLEGKADEERVLAAVESARDLGPQGGLRVQMKHMNRFGGRVLWAEPYFPSQEQLQQLVQWRQQMMTSLEDLCTDGKPWSPHATVMKTSKLRGRSVAFDDQMLEDANQILGEVSAPILVSEVTLLSCRKDSDHRYIRCGSIPFPSG